MTPALEEKPDLAGSSAEKPVMETEALPLSFAQQRLWLLDQLEPGSSAYIVPCALRLRGPLDRPRLLSALQAIVRRHEALRTSFALVQGTPRQFIRASMELELPVSQWRPDGSEPDGGLASRLATEAGRPFDLSKDLLIRAVLFELGAEEHVLLLCLHHIVCDEWSLRVLVDELLALYQGGKEASLPELLIQYADYALWQRESLAGSTLERHLAYWKARLQGDSSPLRFSGARAVDGEGAGAARRASLALPAALSAGLNELSRREGVTLFTVLLAAFKSLLHRQTGQDEITIGSPISGRGRVETESLIGFFVNTLVLRTDLGGDPTFREALSRVRETLLGAYEHQDVPFEKLVEELQPNRISTRVPLVNVVFSLEHPLPGSLQSKDLELSLVDVATQAAKFDLTWAVRDRDGQLDIVVEYPESLFEPDAVQRLLSQWQMLLGGICADPNQRLSALPLASSTEQQRVIVDWNQTDRPYPAQASLAALFAAQVQRTPDHVAVQFGPERLTYAELDARSAQVARLLNEEAECGRPVALFLERSIDLIVAMVGVIKTGRAYVPLDPDIPADRLRYMLDDAAASVVFTRRCLQAKLPGLAARVVAMEDLPSVTHTPVPAAGGPDALAYIIYTSGSAGQPKGVLIPQRGIVRLVCGADYVSWQTDDRVAQCANSSFDAATFEIWGPLLNGGTIVGFTRETMLNPKEFADRLSAERITTLFLTTAWFNQMAAEAPRAFANLRHLLFGGEAVDPPSVRRVLAAGPPRRLLHVYGPTETTTFASWHLVEQVPVGDTTVPIGRPIANTRIYLLDSALRPVPSGVPGEICIGGPGVGLGYLNQTELTERKFVPDPFSTDGAARLYRTGDLGRYRVDGAIEFLGRRDGQVKIRGFRVELSEIEAVLRAHPAVRECVVTAAEGDPVSGRRLIAYLVLKEAAEGVLEQVRRFAREKLPAYMQPAAVVPLERLPLNVNGKVDRRALPAPEPSRPDLSAPFLDPRGTFQERLAALWRDVLRLDRVGARDNFFDLGGHSLLAVQLFSRIEAEFGARLPLATLFQSPTLEQLAAKLEKEVTVASTWPLLVEIQPQGTKPPIFWVHSLGGDGGGAFFYYRKLAQLLGPDQPSYGIRSPREPLPSIEAMAACYTEELLRFQPAPPYLLGGFCFGGIVAFEMARQLNQRGQEVGLLVLLESAPPGLPRFRWGPGAGFALAANLRRALEDLIAQGPGEFTRRVQRKFRFLSGSFPRFGTRRAVPAPRDGLAELIDMSTYPKDYVRYARAHWDALLRYRAQPYAGHITLFRARKQPLLCLDPTLGWSAFAQGGVAVNIVPGTHEKMLEEPNVQILANELRACLAEAQPELPEDVEPADQGDGFRRQGNRVPASACCVIT